MQTTTSVELDHEMNDRLQRLASVRHRSADWLLREAVEQYVEREEGRQKMRQDAVSAWEDFQATGLHLTSEEADEWLSKLESGQDVAPPACRS